MNNLSEIYILSEVMVIFDFFIWGFIYLFFVFLGDYELVFNMRDV